MSLLLRFWNSETKVVLGDVLIALCLLVNFSRTAHGVCPYGWKDYPGSLSCYLITDYQVRYSFDRAIDQCTAHQGQLVVIDEQTEMTWLGKEIQQIISAGIPPKMAWWIGIEDKGQGVRYLNGSDINMDLLPWSGGVPQTPATSRRCGSFMNGKVYLSNCSSWFGLVCERSKALPLLCDVENAWVFINGSCFKYFPSQMTWFLAKSTCEQFEADLPKVVTAEEVAFVWDKAKMSSTLSWIGLKSDIETRTYKWTDGSTLDPALLWWNTNQPQDLTYMMYTDPDICGYISGNGSRRLSSWMTEDCNERHSFTCSKPQGLCADGWISHQGMCIRFFPKYLQPWSSARQYCQSMGADLIIIPTQSYQDLVNLYLKELNDAAVDSFWLGIEDSGNQTFGWVNHKYNMNWTNWAGGAAKNNPDTHEVAFISTGDKYGKWQLTSDLSTRRAFACFISGTTPVKDVPPPLDITCPDQWEVAGDSCVFVSYNDASWSQADNYCQQLQSQLMVVNSAAAQSFFNSRITTGQFWIGLSDRTAEGTFIWVNGTQLNLTSWATGQPDNNKGNENCVMVKASREGAKWYDLSCQEENNYICQRQPLNKSGSTYPDTTASPVAYSARCGVFWEERTGTDFCYQFRDTALSWSDALEMCNSFNGSLVSITSRDEQSYIEGRLSSLTSADFWLGASDRRREAGWQWEDGSPFAYLNWFPSEPNDRSREDCVAMNTGTMMWYDYPCNRRIGFVCKRAADNDQVTPTPVVTVPTALPAGQYYGCPLGWLSYENSCYLLRKVPTTWLDAQMACRQEGAGLASVSSDLENKFIWSQLPKEACQNSHSNDSQCQAWADTNECQKNPSWMSVNCRMACSLCTQTCSDKHTHFECRFWASIGECRQNPDWMWENCALSCGCDPSINEGFWLGLNDRHSQMTFVWDDLSPVTFTNWLPNEPNNYKGKNEDCVKMHTTDGEWSDEKCEQKNTGYICEKQMAVLDTPTISPDKIGCPIAGFAYGSRCFVIIDSPKTWQDAKDYCSMKNATLVTIPDSITGAFITSELVHKTSSYWIGLSNMADMYRWDSGSDVEYLAWSPSHTGNQNNSCVAIRSQKPVGLWEDLNCQSLQPFICETYRRGFTPAATTTTSVPTTLAQCPPSWSDYSNHCYKMFFNKKNWFDAQTACEGFGGSLVSISDDKTNVFIKSLTGWNLAGGFWIGLNDRDEESSYVWSDGSPFQFSKWGKGEPNNATTAEDCVEELTTTMSWNDVNCYLSRAYACAIVRGVPLPTVTPSVSTTAAPRCQDAGWWFHDGSCYYLSPEFGKNASVTWFESRRICQWMGGDLASIISEDENNFLINEFSRREMSTFWIGLNQLEQTSYVWTDGGPQSFVAWGPNEPNDFMGGERCVAMDGNRGIWQDEECMTDHSFVCKKLNETSTTAQVSTPAYMGTCPQGFVSGGVNNKCYYIGGRGNLTSDDPKRSWEDARNFCRNLTSPTLVDIGSIHSLADQDFVTSLMYDIGTDLWIGLSDRVVANTYRWQDNSEVTFTNWASGQPVRHFVWTLNQDNCVEMLQHPHRTEDTAKWNDAPCSKKNAFLCQTLQSPAPTSSPPSTTSETSSSPVCPSDFFLYKSACYSVVTAMKTWPDARNSCQSFNGDLASTSDIFEVARLDLAVLSSGIIGQAWIGMKFDQISSEYVFSDGWPVKHTFWSKSNPNLQTNDSCVALSLASWDDRLCSEVLPYICEIKSEAPPAPTSASAGKCLDPSQVSFGDSCYVAKLKDSVSWPEASYKCGQLGMEMTSVHSEEENRFLKAYVEHVAVPNSFGLLPRSVWLGLQKGLQGSYRWSDRSQVTYFNWGQGEPSAVNNKGVDEECVELYRDSGQWNDLPCLGHKLGYVCKVNKILPSTSSPTTEPTQTSAITSASIITTVITGTDTTNVNVTNMPWTSASVRQSSPSMFTPAQSPLVQDEDKKTLSAGKIAGIVIGIFGFIIIATGVISIIRHRNISGKYKHFPKVAPAAGFENALYTQEQDVQSGEVTGEVTIGASELHRQSIELDSRVAADVSET